VAAADIFLTIKGPDIQGESLDKVHTNMIECLSFNWGQANLGTAGTGGGAGAGAVVKQDLTITKYVDKASNVLAQGCAAGVHYTSASLYVRKSGGDPLDYLQFDPTTNRPPPAPAQAPRRSATTTENRRSCRVNERAHLPARASPRAGVLARGGRV